MSENNLLDILFKKLDKMDDRLDHIDKKLAVYNAELKLHIEGVTQNRSVVQHLIKSMEPLKKHVNMIEGGLKLIGIVAVLLGIAASIFKLLN